MDENKIEIKVNFKGRKRKNKGFENKNKKFDNKGMFLISFFILALFVTFSLLYIKYEDEIKNEFFPNLNENVEIYQNYIVKEK